MYVVKMLNQKLWSFAKTIKSFLMIQHQADGEKLE